MKLFDESSFHIVEARNGDYAALADIHAQGFDHAWSEDEIASTLAGKGVVCFAASIRGKGSIAKGFIIVRTVADEAELLTVSVDKKFRKLGIARALVEHAIRNLQADRIASFYLEVSEHNTNALNLYRSLNFKQIGEREGYYKTDSNSDNNNPSPSANALVMQLELGY